MGVTESGERKRAPKGAPIPHPYIGKNGQQRTDAAGRLGWRLRFTRADGGQANGTFYGTKEEAEKELDRRLTASDQTPVVSGKERRVSLLKYVTEWADDYRYDANGRERIRSTWIEHTSNVSRYIEPCLRAHVGPDGKPDGWDKRKLAAFSLKDLRTIINTFTLVDGGPPSDSMRHSVRKTLRMALAQAVRDGIVAKNPLEGEASTWSITPVAKTGAYIPDLKAVEAVASILEEMPSPRRSRTDSTAVWDGPARPWLADILRFLFWSGLRPGEALGLRVDCVDEDARTIRVERIVTISGGRVDAADRVKSKGSERTLPILEPAQPLVERMLDRAYELNSDHVCVGAGRRAHRKDADGKWVTTKKPEAVGYSTFAEALRHACAIAVEEGFLPKPFTPHKLRHACIQHLLNAGVPEDQVSAWAGHSSTRMTRDLYGRARNPATMVAQAAAADERLAAYEAGKPLFPGKAQQRRVAKSRRQRNPELDEKFRSAAGIDE